MRKIMLFFCLSITVHYTYAQLIGIGFGTSGFNVKLPIESPLKVIARVNPEYTKQATIINVSAMIGRNLLVENYCELYLGLSLGTATTEISRVIDQKKWFFAFPLGLELHPFANRRITFALEAGPALDFERLDTAPETKSIAIGPSGLVEFSYYLW